MTILLVDDDADSRLLIRMVAEAEALPDVVAADSGAQGCEIVERNAAGIDLILMNIQMPKMDGIAAVRKIKAIEAARDIPVIMVTTQYEPEILQRAYAAGAMDYVRKPLERAEFVARVRSALALRHETAARKARERELVALNERLEASLAALKAGLDAAAKVQRSLLPDSRLELPGFAWASRFAPCESIGGDLFGLQMVTPGTAGFYLLDVAGHGVPAAMLCVGLHRLLSAAGAGYVLDAQGRLRPPPELATQLNREFQISGDFLSYFTMIYGTLDATAGSLEFVQAGHPPMVLLPPGEAARFVGEGDLAIGLMPRTAYRSQQIELAVGARIVLYSDGVIEAERYGDGEMFGSARLLALAESARGASPDIMLDEILHAVTVWKGTSAQADDISLFAIERI